MNLETKFSLVFESLCPFIFFSYANRDKKKKKKRASSILLEQNENAHLNQADILGEKRKTKPQNPNQNTKL